jgi:hypothetical protein
MNNSKILALVLGASFLFAGAFAGGDKCETKGTKTAKQYKCDKCNRHKKMRTAKINKCIKKTVKCAKASATCAESCTRCTQICNSCVEACNNCSDACATYLKSPKNKEHRKACIETCKNCIKTCGEFKKVYRTCPDKHTKIHQKCLLACRECKAACRDLKCHLSKYKESKCKKCCPRKMGNKITEPEPGLSGPF